MQEFVWLTVFLQSLLIVITVEFGSLREAEGVILNEFTMSAYAQFKNVIVLCLYAH